MKIKIVMPKRKQPVFKVFKGILRFFYKCNVLSLEGEVPEKAIVIANHSAKSGPTALEINYPKFNVKWGAHQMLGNYKSRFLYLRNVLYVQKCGKNKFVATLKSLFEALFSKMVYRGMKVFPSYQDGRLRKTINASIDALNENMSILIFPENSNSGYFDELKELFGGFVILAEQYYRKTGEDLPIIPTYYHKKTRQIIIGRKSYLQQLKAQGLDRDGVCEYYKNEINDLYRKYILKDVK